MMMMSNRNPSEESTSYCRNISSLQFV